MEEISSIEDVVNLKENNVIVSESNNVQFKNSFVRFSGKNNYLIIDKDASLINTKINFFGSNSIVHIAKTRNNKIHLNLNIYNDSTISFNEGCSFNGVLSIIASESKDIIIGKDCMFSFGCWIRNSDVHLIYDIESNKRINKSKDIYIGDHVWIGQDTKILKGAKIGSGSILASGAIVTHQIPNNSIYGGIPGRIIKENIYWDRQSSHAFTEQETSHFTEYPNEADNFIFKETESQSSIKRSNDIEEYIQCLLSAKPLWVSKKPTKISLFPKLINFANKSN